MDSGYSMTLCLEVVRLNAFAVSIADGGSDLKRIIRRFSDEMTSSAATSNGTMLDIVQAEFGN